LLEKLTELGVTNFVPLACARSNAYPRENKQDKLERYVIEASKQCGRNVLMRLDERMDWETYCERGNLEETRMLAHPYQAAHITTCTKMPQSTRIAVGPEGGFTDEEVALALEHGWQSVSLGPRILRVETAAIVLAALVIQTV
jgi:16S rRNA (uracil1498-N3)-methyltransferase